MRDLRIVFMGTPEFAVESLKAIVDTGFNVVGVITAPDKPAGRGRKLQESAVKKYAVEQGLPLLQPVNLKSEDFLQQLRAWQPNLQVVVAFRMLPKAVWDLPEYGTFNLHASLLPHYRGAAPINWAIINGETTTGVSTFFLDEKIDTGEMILQEAVEIGPKDDAGVLHDKLMTRGSELVIETLKKIREGEVVTTPQKEATGLRDAFKLTKENTRIDWSQPLEQIYNHIRGLSPYPAAWTILYNEGQEFQFKIYSVEMEAAAHEMKPGTLLQEGKKVKIAVQGGFLELMEVQLPGKRKMSVRDLLNGFSFAEDAKVL